MNNKQIIYGLMFLLVAGIVFAVQGENLAYYFNATCGVTPENIGCSGLLNYSCNITNYHLVDHVNFTIDDIMYTTEGYVTWWTLKNVTVYQNYSDDHNLSMETIIDTLGNRVILEESASSYQDCCYPDYQLTYETCRINDTQVKYYTDANGCGGTPPANETIECDYCEPEWFCSGYENVSFLDGADCQLEDYYDCTNVSDTNSCYGFTGLGSDLFTGNVSLYDLDCSEYYIELQINYYVPYWENIQLLLNIYYSYPYVDLNESVWMEVVANWQNGTKLEIDELQMDMTKAGTNESWLFNFTWNASTETYWQHLIWAEEDSIGDYPFEITGSDVDNEIFGITGTFLVRDMIEINISLYTSKNISSNEWINDFGYVFITEESNAPSSELDIDLIEMIEPLERTVLMAEKLAGLNKTTLYTYGKNVWYAPYQQGMASIKIPKDVDQAYGIKFANANSNMDWQMPSTNFGIPSSRSADKFNMMDLGTFNIARPVHMQFYVSKADRNWFEVWTRAGLIIILASIVLIVLFFVARATQDPIAVVKLATAMLVVMPIIYGIIKWIFL